MYDKISNCTDCQVLIKLREYFFAKTKKFADPYKLEGHIIEMEKWGNVMCNHQSTAEPFVVFSAIYLHDIGHYPIITGTDHAILGENISSEILQEFIPNDSRIQRILHCVRAHRCLDIQPVTLEAKIIAFIDSASHLTDSLYIDILKKSTNRDNSNQALLKLERDYRDLSFFPDMKEQMYDLYIGWKELLRAMHKSLMIYE